MTTTTNTIVSHKKLLQIIPLIDEFTVSYHAENTAKQKQQFKDNLLTIAGSGVRQKCVIMMNPTHFQDCNEIITWLTHNNIRYLPKQLDSQKNYSTSEIQWFDKFYKSKIFGTSTHLLDDLKKESQLSEVGRACCGGRSFCIDQQYKQRPVYVENKFPDWYCSVNHFFLYVKQVNGEVFVNKDCKMNFDGQVGPIGNLSNTQQILSTLRNQLDTDSMPVIQCKKYNCFCGLCAPKAKDLSTYNSIMEKYHI